MFYSHEILTSREHGVATVWLVATLGAAETRRKLNRVEIQRVNVPKACKTITSTSVPLALRLQSSLLFGVSKVYSQQCAFVLNDAEHVHAQVRNAMDLFKATSTTTKRGYVVKEDQITLADDPDFSLEGIPFEDLTSIVFGQDLLATVRDSNLVALGSQSTELSSLPSHLAAHNAGLNIHNSTAEHSAGRQSLISRSPTRSNISTDRQGDRLEDVEAANARHRDFLDDIGFSFDQNGELVDSTQRQIPTIANPVVEGGLAGSDARAGVEGGAENDARSHDVMPQLEDGYHVDPNAEPLSPLRSHRKPTQGYHESDEAIETTQEIDTAADEVQVAPNKVRRKPKIMSLDRGMELDNNIVKAWSDSYKGTVEREILSRFQASLRYVAKSNAQAWVFNDGLFGLGVFYSSLAPPPALQGFLGSALQRDMRTSTISSSPASSKRAHSVSSKSGERQVRPRLDRDTEHGRPEANIEDLSLVDGLPTLDDVERSIEAGRLAATPLADRDSSHMPWNISASKRGSSAQRQLPLPSLGGASSSYGGPMSVRGRGSSTVPSPLYPQADENDIFGTDEEGTFQLPVSDTGYGESAPMQDSHAYPGQIDPQGVSRGSLPWAAKTMDAEEQNFFAFVREYLDAQIDAHVDVPAAGGELRFSDVFPFHSTDRVVAAQALMHILALNGKNVLSVQQDSGIAFQPITLHLL